MNESAKTEKPKFSERTWLHPLAEVELNGLVKRGVKPTWDQVVMLHELCKKTETKARREAAATGTPRTLGERTLYPLTVQAAEWYVWTLENVAESWHLFALVYAHENARDEDAFLGLYSSDRVAHCLTLYKRTLKHTLSEVVIVLADLNKAGEDSTEDDSDSTDFGDIIATLVAKTGVSPDVWRSRVSIGYITKQIDAIRMYETGESEASAEYIQAEKNIGLALMEIKRSQNNES